MVTSKVTKRPADEYYRRVTMAAKNIQELVICIFIGDNLTVRAIPPLSPSLISPGKKTFEEKIGLTGKKTQHCWLFSNVLFSAAFAFVAALVNKRVPISIVIRVRLELL